MSDRMKRNGNVMCLPDISIYSVNMLSDTMGRDLVAEWSFVTITKYWIRVLYMKKAGSAESCGSQMNKNAFGKICYSGAG